MTTIALLLITIFGIYVTAVQARLVIEAIDVARIIIKNKDDIIQNSIERNKNIEGWDNEMYKVILNQTIRDKIIESIFLSLILLSLAALTAYSANNLLSLTLL